MNLARLHGDACSLHQRKLLNIEYKTIAKENTQKLGFHLCSRWSSNFKGVVLLSTSPIVAPKKAKHYKIIVII